MQSQMRGRKSQKEEVRPIFWANRPKSYLQRTMTWDEFPNGRWGDARSPAFGSLNDYHLCSLTTAKTETRRGMWGDTLTSFDDVASVFVKYIRGAIPKLPWCDTQLSSETSPLTEALVRMNTALFFTINSQPRINGADSTDANIGWGGPGGYIYQKAYLEFFTTPANVEKLIHVSRSHSGITWHAVNSDGLSLSNSPVGTNAVTWGVFPGKEIIQPTVVDGASFAVWKVPNSLRAVDVWGRASYG
jgi:methylenetetrahydrofolate reductase (NADPH)